MPRIQMETSQNMTVKEGAEEFLETCKALNYSPFTVTYYRNTLHNFSLFYDLENDLSTIDLKLVKKYETCLVERGLSGKTVKTYITGLRTILYYFMKEGWLEPFHIPAPKIDEKIKDVYTDDELRKLLKKPDINKCTFATYRNWVLVSYFIGTGQRLNSVINIKNKDIDLSNETVVLHKTKARKDVLLPLPHSLVKILREYMRIRKGDMNDYLFCTQYGCQMTNGGVIDAIRAYNRSRGVEKTSVHLFRHTYAKNYLNNGGNVFKLQKLMAHSDLMSTQKYLNLEISDIQRDYQQYNQLDKLTYRERIHV